MEEIREAAVRASGLQFGRQLFVRADCSLEGSCSCERIAVWKSESTVIVKYTIHTQGITRKDLHLKTLQRHALFSFLVCFSCFFGGRRGAGGGGGGGGEGGFEIESSQTCFICCLIKISVLLDMLCVMNSKTLQHERKNLGGGKLSLPLDTKTI